MTATETQTPTIEQWIDETDQALAELEFAVALREGLFAELDRLAETNTPAPPVPDVQRASIRAAEIRRTVRKNRRSTRARITAAFRGNDLDTLEELANA